MADRDECVYRAKLAEQAERYDEMVDHMKRIAVMGSELTVEERNLLSVAYKNVIGVKRSSWRVLASEEEKEKSKESPDEDRQALIKSYKNQIATEIKKYANEVIENCLVRDLIPLAALAESKVFYRKMKGDYYRYIAEVSVGQNRTDAAEACLMAYKEASEIADSSLEKTNPILLGLALNFSVFYYEILNSPAKACHLAKEAFDAAITELDSLSEEVYKDSTLIMQLLRDNLSLWTSDLAQNNYGTEAENQDVEQQAAN